MKGAAPAGSEGTVIIGAGFTGLAAAYESDAVVYEATDRPGGICASYYMRPGSAERLPADDADGCAYRFEIGGGHWIFGGDRTLVEFLHGLAPLRRYQRRSTVFFSRSRTFVDYPLQDHLEQIEPDDARRARAELAAAGHNNGAPLISQKDWLTARFGPTLCDLFFHPFNERYTAGLYDRIAPQDAYKSPRGGNGTPSTGYNATFVYPEDGLDVLAQRFAQRCRVNYGKRVVSIDPAARHVTLDDGTTVRYERLVSTLPLNATMRLAGLKANAPADPHTSALVLNIGAVRGSALPDHHWLYVPDARAGFHRVGIYSNVDRDFLPRTAQSRARASFYVERAYADGNAPGRAELASYIEAVVQELRDWGFIDAVEIVDPSWIEVAYTWTWPGSRWRERALEALAKNGIYAAGRYGRWTYQGIADSIRDGRSLESTFVST